MTTIARPLLVSVAFITLSVASASVARAQASAADAQFDFGLAEMQEGRYETGCPALEDSYRLDPKPGSLFTLAECEWRWGKVTAALTHYDTYLDLFSRMSPDQQSRQRGRDKLAATKRDELRGRVPTLTLAFSRPPPKGTTVKRDGVPLGPAAVGAPVPLEAGEHVIEVLVPGGPVRLERVHLAAGEARRLVLVIPEADLGGNVTSTKPESALSSSPEPSALEATDAPLGPTPMRIGSYVAAGVGGVGIAVGAVFGVMTLSHKKDIDEHCVDVVCDATGKHAADSASSTATVSTIGFVVGGVGAITAIALLVLDSKRAASTLTSSFRPIAAIGPGHGALGIAGSF